MPRLGELTYFEVIGDAGRAHAVNKPFSDDMCGVTLMQVGAVISLLPPPPARVLDCGCGTGWLAYMLQKHGYQVVGTDVSADAIELARSNPMFADRSVPEFVVADSESLTFDAEFDAVVFFDSLHHAVHEQKAVQSAFRALKPGGVCVVSEPGRGHESRSTEVIAQYDVTEKDMPPTYVKRLGKIAGFKRFKVYPRADHLGRVLYTTEWEALGWKSRLLKLWPVKYLALLGFVSFLKPHFGLVVMEKDAPGAGRQPRRRVAGASH